MMTITNSGRQQPGTLTAANSIFDLDEESSFSPGAAVLIRLISAHVTKSQKSNDSHESHFKNNEVDCKLSMKPVAAS